MTLLVLTTAECKRLIALLGSQFQTSSLDTQNSSTHHIASVSNINGIISTTNSSNDFLNSSSWILDSGATHHVCCSRDSFIHIFPISNSTVTLPTGQIVPITHTESVLVHNALLLHNVLFVPSFHFNLISVSLLTDFSPLILVNFRVFHKGR